MQNNPQSPKVKQVELRSTVEIHLPDGRILEGPRGEPVETFLRGLPEWRETPVVGAIINSELRELTFPIEMESKVIPISMNDVDGARIYRRSITFLLEAAFDDIFPDLKISVDHSVASGGFFCEVIDHAPLDREDLMRLENRMHELVKADICFERQEVPLKEAIEWFRERNLMDKVHLLKFRQKDYLVLYRLGKHRDYHHGYMVPSTGYLKWFAISPLGEGFVLRYPRRKDSKELVPILESPTLLKTFRQYGNWLARLGIDSTGALNEAIIGERINELVLMSEALHEQKIAEIASQIAYRKGQVHVVLIAGPSSSGKTTFSKRLAVQLLANGIEPYAMELDNYFVDREKTPKDEKGEYDFESIDALDTVRLNQDLLRLIAGEEVQIPRYNFKTGKSENGEIVRLKKDQLMILEGIHGLNPKLVPHLPQEYMFRIYASCLTQLNLDRHNRISTTDTRLIRRIVRDARERGYTAQQTIKRWESVRRGEKMHIFPFQENANEMFNSALVYELAALKPFAEPLLRQVTFGTREYIEAKRLLALLEWFLPVPVDLIPDNSIEREFVGGSILKNFKLWKSGEDENSR
jgi:uridine kinase